MRIFIALLLGFTIYLTNGTKLEFDSTRTYYIHEWGKMVGVREVGKGTLLMEIPVENILYMEGNDK